MTLKNYFIECCNRYEWRKGEKRVISLSTGKHFANEGAGDSKRGCIGVLTNPYDILRTMPTWADKSIAVTYGLVHDDQHIYVID